VGQLFAKSQSSHKFCKSDFYKKKPTFRTSINSRGLARALTGNYPGTIEDFQAYIQQTKDKTTTRLDEGGEKSLDSAVLQKLLTPP